MSSIEITKRGEHGPTHKCTCGHSDSSEIPVLNATLIPKQIRHAAIIGALDSLKPGFGLIVQTGHKPAPLLAQIEHKFPGKFELTFPIQEQDMWHSKFVRLENGNI
jgi:uncharacterized protein (DUF2249 family)